MLGLNLKKKSSASSAQAGTEQAVSDDLIVHNMPPADRLSGSLAFNTERPKEITSFSARSLSLGAPQHNFKMVGFLIIGGGLIFIGLLFYLSYRYIIVPAASPKGASESVINVPTSSPQAVKVDSNAPVDISSVSLDQATTTAMATSAVTILDPAASSTVPASEEGTALAPLLDSDQDGLNDEEEVAFGSNSNLADTNNNTYSDLTEILNNYNPIGSGRLASDSALISFVSQVLGYSVLIPKEWPAKSLNNDNTILFNAPDDSLIQISLQDNTDQQSILGWYGEFFPADSVTYDRLKSQETWDGIWDAEGVNFYLTDKKRQSIYIVSYIPAVDGRVVYPNVFKMLIDSLVLK